MVYDDPDIDRCFQLLDSSSSSPFRSDDAYGQGVGLGGETSAHPVGSRALLTGPERVRGGDEYGAAPLPDFLLAGQASNRLPQRGAYGETEFGGYDNQNLRPSFSGPKISLHPSLAPRRSPSVGTMLPPSIPFQQDVHPQGPLALPVSTPTIDKASHYIGDTEDLGGPKPPFHAFYTGTAHQHEKWDNDDEYDGVFEALAERDAAQGLVKEAIATAEVIQGRSKTALATAIAKNMLVPTSELEADVSDPSHEHLFSFPTFNKMQSKVFADVYATDENLVVTAPTSSGKTVIFELAYLRMRKESPGRLAIYMAPTKVSFTALSIEYDELIHQALCSERARDWKHRFGSVGTCVEITGDTNHVGLDKLLATADLLVITPEKLDVLSRKSAKYSSLDNLRLVMIDEVHILGESRGATLEVVMSRLKKRCSPHEPIRFVAVSATVPNIKDVAKWLAPPRAQITTGVFINGINEEAEAEQVEERLQLATMPEAKLWQFGEDYRPVPLAKIVNGYDGNAWTLGKKLDQELMPLIFEHGKGKPIMVFCPTRKSCQATAALLHERYQEIRKGASSSKRPPPWPRGCSDGSEPTLVDSQLKTWWESGIAVHHAGLENTDRRTIEDGYRSGAISVICCTSTLAVGVNLPAHLVIIKGTQTWAGAANGMREYSDVDIQQMMGRAGRPQYDTSGTVIIMCEKTKVGMYRQKIFSKTVLESCLHTSLSEHINSEVGLGTISSLKGAQEWLEGSFLWIRIQQNPRAYTSIQRTLKEGNESWDKVLERYVKQLRGIELVSHRGWNEEVKKAGTMADNDPMEELEHTALGKIMSECCILLGTMESIVELGPTADLQDCLETLSGACEFEDLRVRQGEAAFLNQLRMNPEIRFPLADPVKTYADKVFLLLQGRFAAIEWDSVKTKTKTENSSAQQTLFAIYQSAPRIALVLTTRNFGSASKAGLQLLRVVNGKSWEDQASVFQQLRNVGPKSMKVLGANNILTWTDLIKTPPSQLEHWLARNPPFGSNLIREALAKDRYEVMIKQDVSDTTDQDGFPVITFTVNLKNVKKGGEEKQKDGTTKWAKRQNLSILTVRSDGGWIDYRRAIAKKITKTEFELSTELTSPDQRVEIHAGVDEISGLSTKAILDPDLSQYGEIDYETCRQNRSAREVQEAKDRLRAVEEANGETIKARDVDAEAMKNRDRSVRNRKVRAEDFRKDTAHEGGWTMSKTVPKPLQALGADGKAAVPDTRGDESDEAEEDNRFDGGDADERSKGGGHRQLEQASGPKRAQKIRSKRPTSGVAQYIDDYAEESDDEEEEERTRRRKTSRTTSSRRDNFINDDEDEIGDDDVEELIDCTAPAYVPKPGSKRDLQQRGIAIKRRHADPDSGDDDGASEPRTSKRSVERSLSPLPAKVKSKKREREAVDSPVESATPTQFNPPSPAADTLYDREDSLDRLLKPKSTLSLFAPTPHHKAADQLDSPAKSTQQRDKSDASADNADDWVMDEGMLANFIIEPESPTAADRTQIEQYHAHTEEKAYYPDGQPLEDDRYAAPAEDFPSDRPMDVDFKQHRTPKPRVRFASQDYVQEMQATQGESQEMIGGANMRGDGVDDVLYPGEDYEESQATQQDPAYDNYDLTPAPIQAGYAYPDRYQDDQRPYQDIADQGHDYSTHPQDDLYSQGMEGEYDEHAAGGQEAPVLAPPHLSATRNHSNMASSDSIDPASFDAWLSETFVIEG